MPKRDLSNLARWALEDAYAALESIERDLGPLMSDQQPTRTALISALAHARLSAANARAKIIEVHPKVRRKATGARQ